MRCFVYRSNKKAETYLYLLERDGISSLPEGLIKLLGKIEFALEVDLGKTNRLANAEVEQVIESLHLQGYYLQLPKELHISE